MRLIVFRVAIIFSAICFAGSFSSWAVPALMNYQGTLAGNDGEYLDGPFSINYLIYDVETHGDPTWKETRDVLVSNGTYSVQLGSIIPFPPGLFDNDDLFLEIQIYNEDSRAWETLGPRMRLTATAFAMKAAEAESVSSGAITGIMLSPGAVTSQVLSDQSVTSDKISSGAVGSAQIGDGSVAAADVAFNYAAGSAKGGAALDLDCTDCVASPELQIPLNLNGASPLAIVKGTNSGSGYGLQGDHGSGNYGYLGGSGAGVYGRAANGNTGWLGSPSYGVYGYSASGYAGLFAGDVSIFGTGKGLTFADGTRQTSAANGGVPPGFCILGKNAEPPAGYTAGGAYVSAFSGTPDQWKGKTAIPEATGFPAVAEVAGKIYVISGTITGYSPDLTTTFEYNPLNDAWIQKADIPNARYGSGVAVVDSRIYVIGGYGGPTKNESFNPVSNRWTTHVDMPTPRTQLSCAAFNDKIYCFGGENAGSDSSVTEMFDPGTKKWLSLAPMPTPRSGHSAIATESGIFVIGGSDRNDVYDPLTNTWTSRAPLLSARQYLATVMLNGKIHALGGGHWIRTNCQERCGSFYDCNEDIWVTSDSMEIYDPGVDQWTAKRMSGPRMAFGSAVLNKKAYLMGGMVFNPDNPYYQYWPLDAASEYTTNSIVFYLFEKG